MTSQPPPGPPPGDAAGVELGIEGVVEAQEIGRGGFGIVYRARQPQFNRTVAVKLITVPVVDEAARRRFERELSTMGTLSGHPNIVPVFSAGFTRSGYPYLVMEDMGGGSLAEMLKRRGPLPWTEVVAIGTALADALEAAHKAGVLHRDVKPANVLISRYGTYKLGDFGIARLDEADTARTSTMALSVMHAPPEVLNGMSPSVAADVYSLGSTLHTLLSGNPPFAREGEGSLYPTAARIQNEPAPSLRPYNVPEPICRVVEHAMDKDPARRPASAAALGQELRDAAKQAETPATALPVALDAPALDTERTVSMDPSMLQGAPAGYRQQQGGYTAPQPPAYVPQPAQPAYGASAQPAYGQTPGGYAAPPPAGGFPVPGYPPQQQWAQPRRSGRAMAWIGTAVVVLLAAGGGGIYLATHRGSTSNNTTFTLGPTGSSNGGPATSLNAAQVQAALLGDNDVTSGFSRASQPGGLDTMGLCLKPTNVSQQTATADREWKASSSSASGEIRNIVASFRPGGAAGVLSQQSADEQSCGGIWTFTDPSSGTSYTIIETSTSPGTPNADDSVLYHLTYHDSSNATVGEEYFAEGRVADVLVVIDDIAFGTSVSVSDVTNMLATGVKNVSSALGR